MVSADLPLLYWASGAFKNCYSLEHLYAPELEELAHGAFANCIKLTEFVKEGEYDLRKIKVLEADAFADSYFKEIELPLIEAFDSGGSGVFQRCHAEYISIPRLKILREYTFYQCKELKHINIPNYVDTLRNPFENVFCDNFALEELYLPNAIYLPDLLVTDRTNSSKMSLKYIFAPKAEELLSRNQAYFLEYCSNLEWAFLPNIKYICELPLNSNAKIYVSEKLEYITFARDGVTLIAPSGSYAESFAKEKGMKFIPSDSRDDSIENPLNVTDLGRSICTSVAGLRFGFTWDNIDEIESLASDIEYGFVYSQKGVEDLSLDKVDDENVKAVTATNRIDHGNTTSFNLVISNIPKSYYNREITARAYVCIDGMYFYSNEQKGSFGEVANLVLADNEIDTNTKNAVKNLLEV